MGQWTSSTDEGICVYLSCIYVFVSRHTCSLSLPFSSTPANFVFTPSRHHDPLLSMRQEFVILLSVAGPVWASPTLSWDSKRTPRVLARRLGRRDGLPPISQVVMALRMQTVVSDSPSTRTVLSSVVSSSTGASSPKMTPPYTGPGIVVLPESSFDVQSTTTTTSSLPSTTATRAIPSQTHMSPTMRHLAVVGSAFGIILFLVLCCFFVMDPRVWKVCSMTRKARRLRSKRPLPQWMRITPGSGMKEKTKEKTGLPVLSPYPYCCSDGPKSKFSMTTASDYSYCDDSLDDTTTVTASPKMATKTTTTAAAFRYDGLAVVTPPLPIYVATMDRVGRPIIPPVRPPRPPTADSPAMIESMYYADVDDPGFYRHPHPIVLESDLAPASDTTTTNNTLKRNSSHSSVVFGLDALQRHNRSKSAPTLDTLSTKSSRHLSLGGSTESHGSTEKGDTSTSWIRYSEFQKQHHLQMISDSERPVLCPTEG